MLLEVTCNFQGWKDLHIEMLVGGSRDLVLVVEGGWLLQDILVSLGVVLRFCEGS